MAKHIRIKRGTMQDAFFIEAGRGEYGKQEEIMQSPADLKMVHLQQRIIKITSDKMHIHS